MTPPAQQRDRCVLTRHDVQSTKDLVFVVGGNSESGAQKAIFEILANNTRRSSPAPSADSCVWIDEFHEGNYSTGCGNMFTVMEGTPEENDMKFCPYCGKPLRQRQQHPNGKQERDP